MSASRERGGGLEEVKSTHREGRDVESGGVGEVEDGVHPSIPTGVLCLSGASAWGAVAIGCDV